MPRFLSLCTAVWLVAAASLLMDRDRTRVRADAEASASSQLLSQQELLQLLETVQAGDDRIMRWSVRNPTRIAVQQGACEALPKALDTIIHEALNAGPGSAALSPTLSGLACEYATFCVTDHPEHRALLSQHDLTRLHKAIVALIDHPDNYTSAMASHLTYISAFNNPLNHKQLYKAGAIAALTRVILAYHPDAPSSPRNPHAAMWAAAALQNLAASYCNGRCRWDWLDHTEHVSLDPDSLPVTSAGDSVRLATWMQADGPALLRHLVRLLCRGPVAEGLGAAEGVVRRDEASPNIVPWAAAGALKNLVLEPVMMQFVDRPETMVCLCHMLQSEDWLERNKAEGMLWHVRSGENPCHYRDIEGEDAALECIDRHIADKAVMRCDYYEEGPTEEECASEDLFHPGWTAREACCACGGGYRLPVAREGEDIAYQ